MYGSCHGPSIVYELSTINYKLRLRMRSYVLLSPFISLSLSLSYVVSSDTPLCPSFTRFSTPVLSPVPFLTVEGFTDVLSSPLFHIRLSETTPVTDGGTDHIRTSSLRLTCILSSQSTFWCLKVVLVLGYPVPRYGEGRRVLNPVRFFVNL